MLLLDCRLCHLAWSLWRTCTWRRGLHLSWLGLGFRASAAAIAKTEVFKPLKAPCAIEKEIEHGKEVEYCYSSAIKAFTPTEAFHAEVSMGTCPRNLFQSEGITSPLTPGIRNRIAEYTYITTVKVGGACSDFWSGAIHKSEALRKLGLPNTQFIGKSQRKNPIQHTWHVCLPLE